MSKKRAKGAAGQAAPPTGPQPLPDAPHLVVTATVTVTVLEDQSAHVVMHAGCEGAKVLVALMRSVDPKLQMVGRGLRTVVMDALQLSTEGRTVTVLEDDRRIGRA